MKKSRRNPWAVAALATVGLSLLVGCSSGPFGNKGREMEELRRTRDKEIKEMESGSSVRKAGT